MININIAGRNVEVLISKRFNSPFPEAENKIKYLWKEHLTDDIFSNISGLDYSPSNLQWTQPKDYDYTRVSKDKGMVMSVDNFGEFLMSWRAAPKSNWFGVESSSETTKTAERICSNISKLIFSLNLTALSKEHSIVNGVMVRYNNEHIIIPSADFEQVYLELSKPEIVGGPFIVYNHSLEVFFPLNIPINSNTVDPLIRFFSRSSEFYSWNTEVVRKTNETLVPEASYYGKDPLRLFIEQQCLTVNENKKNELKIKLGN